MPYLTMPQIAQQLRELADVVETGAGRVLVVLYVDEAGDAHVIRAIEEGHEPRAVFELEDVSAVVAGVREPPKRTHTTPSTSRTPTSLASSTTTHGNTGTRSGRTRDLGAADDPERAKELDLGDVKKSALAVIPSDGRTDPDSYPVHHQVRELDEEFVDGDGRRYMHPPGRPNDREKEIPYFDDDDLVGPPAPQAFEGGDPRDIPDRFAGESQPTVECNQCDFKKFV